MLVRVDGDALRESRCSRGKKKKKKRRRRRSLECGDYWGGEVHVKFTLCAQIQCMRKRKTE